MCMLKLVLSSEILSRKPQKQVDSRGRILMEDSREIIPKKGAYGGNRGGFRNFGNNGNRGNNNFQNRAEERPRIYFCKKCPNNHPGLDCEGNKVTCSKCGKLAHRAYECRS